MAGSVNVYFSIYSSLVSALAESWRHGGTRALDVRQEYTWDRVSTHTLIYTWGKFRVVNLPRGMFLAVEGRWKI